MKTFISAIVFCFCFSAAASAATIRVEAAGLSERAALALGISQLDTITVEVSYDPNNPFSVSDQRPVSERRNIEITSVLVGLNASPTAVAFSEASISILDTSFSIPGNDTRDVVGVTIRGITGTSLTSINFNAVDFDHTSFSGFNPSADELNGMEFKSFTTSADRFDTPSSIVFREAISVSEVPLPMNAALILSSLVILGGLKGMGRVRG